MRDECDQLLFFASSRVGQGLLFQAAVSEVVYRPDQPSQRHGLRSQVYFRKYRGGLSSRDCGTSHTFSWRTLCISPSLCLFSCHFHISHVPAVLARDTLLGVRSHSLHLSMNPKSGTLGGPSLGYPFVQLNSIVTLRIPCSWELVGHRGLDPHMDLKSYILMISPTFVKEAFTECGLKRSFPICADDLLERVHPR